jgi:3-isopropylmalate dehydratase small subunit
MILKHELDLVIDFLETMVTAKNRQIEIEPKESMWKEELITLYDAISLIEMDRESYEEGEQINVIKIQRLN